MEFITKLCVLSLLGFSFHVQFTSASCNIASPIATIELEKIVSLLNESTALNIDSMKVLDDIVPLLMLFRKAVEDSIVEYLMLHAEPSLSEFLDSVIASVTDNIAVMENKMQVIQIAKVIPVRHDQLYRVIDDEINCRVNAYNDFKSRRSEVKETCFYNKFGPAFNKLTNETQSFIKDFMKFLRDGIKIAVAEFKDQIVKWTTDIPDALSCGVTGCVADYIAINKENILKTINIGHDVKSIREHYISLYPVKQKAVESMISDEFNGIYETINECYN